MEKKKRPTGYYEKTLEYAAVNPAKCVVKSSKGFKAGYSDFISSYDYFYTFFIKNSIETHSRIALFIKNEIHLSMLLMPVIDNSTLVMLDSGLKAKAYVDLFDLIGVDYIISDDLFGEAAKAAKESKTGIIKVEFSGGFTQIDCSAEIFKPAGVNKPLNKTNPDIGLIGVTSGTTDVPKIVPTTYFEHNASLMNMMKVFDFTPDDIVLVMAKSFSSVSICELLMTIYAGGSAFIDVTYNPDTFLKIIETEGVTIFRQTPAVLMKFVEYAERTGIELQSSNLKYIRIGGAKLTAALKERIENVLKAPVVHAYGMSEAKNITTTYKAPKGYKEGSAGVPTGIKIKAENGEILIKGDTVFKGYENSDIDNTECFSDGWFRTGDTGYLDEDGYMFITGRIKEMINRGGEKVSPYEVEEAIKGHPKVKDAVVFPYPGSYGSEDIGAAVVFEQDSYLSLVEIRNYLANEMKPYKMPTLLYSVPGIPLGEQGKVQRNKIHELLSNLQRTAIESEKVTERVTEVSDMEKGVVRIWKNALKRKSIPADCKFTDLGGDSLNGSIVLAEIERKYNVNLPVEILFEKGTVADICDYIKGKSAGETGYKFLVPVKETGYKKALICAHSSKGDEVTYRHIGRYMNQDRPVYALKFHKDMIYDSQPLSFSTLASAYADEIVDFDPEGPYHLCGHCWGGVLAFRIASELKARGMRVGILALFDSVDKGTKGLKKAGNVGLIKRFKTSIRDSLSQLKELDAKGKSKLFVKKAGNIINLIKIVNNKKIYAMGVEKNNRVLMRMAGKTGALGYAFQRYRPELYDGEIRFFKAAKGNSGKTNRHIFWEHLSKDLELIEMDCHHNDLITGENAALLVRELEIRMDETDV